MRMHREEGERCYKHEAEIRKAEAEACHEEMRAEAERHRRESKAFCKMMLFMMFGKKQDEY
jgi:hypothetical protein